MDLNCTSRLINESGLSQKTYGLFRQPIIFFSASFLRKKQSFFLKNDALKEFLWAAHNDEGVMRRPPFKKKYFMKVVLQRVSEASVKVDGEITGAIENGLLLLLGIEDADTQEDIEWLCRKVINMRIFNDENGVMNLSVKDIGGALLVVSQFTLHASTKKGNRPSYIKASKPDFAIPMYERFVKQLDVTSGLQVATGIFGADMKVSLTNDGPVTIIIDSKNRE
jgi:D-tyrosyl-tRNA(Tyr) deacylase